MRPTIIELKDGTQKTISLAKSINVICVNEMKALIDGEHFTASYNWEWIADKVLEHNQIKKKEIVDYKDFVRKTKCAYHLVKNPNYSGFNSQIDTYKHSEMGARLVKLSSNTPMELRRKVSNQKKERLFSELRSSNKRIEERSNQIGFSGTGIEYKED